MPALIRTFMALAAALLGVCAAHAADHAFIANSSCPDTLASEDVKSILLGNRTRWDSGENIRLALPSAGPVRESVIQEFTARSAGQFDKYWKRLVFTGKGAAPEYFDNEADLAAYVAKTPGAFGFVSSGVPVGGAKVLKIQ